MATAGGAGARGGAPGAGERDVRHTTGVTAARAFAAAGRHPPATPAASRAAVAGAGLGEELLEAAPDAIVVVDESGRIQRVNEQAEALFGYRRDELVDAPVELLLPARFHDAHRTERSIYVADPHRRPMGEDRDLFARRKDGTEFAVHISLAPLRTSEGLLVLAAVRDVTDRKRTEELLRQAHADLETRARQQAVVSDLGQRGLASAELSALMEHAVAQVRETLGVTYAKVLELLPGGQELLLRAGAGWKDGLVGSATVGADRASQAGYTLLANEPVIVEDLATETRFSGPALLREHAVTSGVSVIIQGEGGPFGVLGAHTTERRAFTGDDVHFLQAVANVLSAAIQRKRAEDRLRLLESAVENANDTIVITDADLGRPGPRIVYVNPAYTRMTGYAAKEVIGGSPRISQGPDTDADVRVRLRQTLEQGRIFRGENVNYRKDGTAYDVELHIAPIHDLAGRTTHFVSVQRDVTERKRAERELERLALYDALTGLPNRGLFHDRLELAIAGASREGSPLALLMVDLDHFKEVNDTFGHPAGDVLLQQVAGRLRAEVRAIDTVARFGGDEYAVLLPEATAASAAKVAQKLLTALERPFTVEAQTVGIGAGVGISMYPDHGEDADVLLRHADIAMYAAKGSGGGHAIYSPDQDQSSPGRLARVAELRQAIDAGALVLHYQPIVSLTTGRVTGIEALARWPHPEHGLIPPMEFILLAERTGLIRPLTEWVLGTAVRQCAAWQQAGHTIPVAVNVSMRNLLDPELPNTIARLLASARLKPSLLRLEITESVMMADPARTMAVVERFRETGVLVDIDDFGTGYSSLAYLQRLPVDVVKIDRSFVGQMTTDEDSAVIVRSMVGLAHSLGLGVVAEGVEDGETWDQLATVGCDEAQGHYLSPPLAASELDRWLTERAVAMRGELMGRERGSGDGSGSSDRPPR